MTIAAIAMIGGIKNVTGTSNAFTVWATGSWKLHRHIATDDQNAGCAFSSDSKLLAITLSASVVQLLDPATGRSFAKLTAPDPDRQSLVSFSPDNTQLVMSTGAAPVRVWDLRRIREQLQEIGLDWDLPPYPPAPPPGDIMPVNVVDLKGKAPRIVNTVDVGQYVEGLAFSDDGNYLAVIPQNGSNLAPSQRPLSRGAGVG